MGGERPDTSFIYIRFLGYSEDVCRNIRNIKLTEVRSPSLLCFPTCVLLSCLSLQLVCYFLLSFDGQRKRIFIYFCFTYFSFSIFISLFNFLLIFGFLMIQDVSCYFIDSSRDYARLADTCTGGRLIMRPLSLYPRVFYPSQYNLSLCEESVVTSLSPVKNTSFASTVTRRGSDT